jgi:hypothetical protein
MSCHQLESETADTEIVRFDDLEQVDEMLLRVSRRPTEHLVLLATGKLADLGHFVSAVVEHGHRRRGVHDAAQPGEGIGSERSLAPVVKIIKPAELVIDAGLIVGLLNQESPQVDSAVGRALDVQIDLYLGLRHFDRSGGFAIKGRAFQQHPRPPCCHLDPAVRSLSMGDFGQIPLHQLIKVGGRKVGDGRDAVAAQRCNFSHVQRALVDAQADIIGVELGEAVLPPLAARAFLVDDGPDQQLGVLLRLTGLLLRSGRDLDPE